MSRRQWVRALGCAPIGWIVIVTLTSASAASQPPEKTIWDGVYSQAQAERGRALYKQHCGHCHRDDLTGGGSEAGAPPLRGPIFFYRWLHLPLSEMFLTIGTTMPQNKPDSLTPQTVIDVVSFLMMENEMPAGKTELPPDLEALKQIQVTESR
jgi:quinoprotein glucose dehydrogenase